MKRNNLQIAADPCELVVAENLSRENRIGTLGPQAGNFARYTKYRAVIIQELLKHFQPNKKKTRVQPKNWQQKICSETGGDTSHYTISD